MILHNMKLLHMDIQVNYAEVIQCSCAFSCHLFIFEYGSNVSVGYHQVFLGGINRTFAVGNIS